VHKNHETSHAFEFLRVARSRSRRRGRRGPRLSRPKTPFVLTESATNPRRILGCPLKEPARVSAARAFSLPCLCAILNCGYLSAGNLRYPNQYYDGKSESPCVGHKKFYEDSSRLLPERGEVATADSNSSLGYPPDLSQGENSPKVRFCHSGQHKSSWGCRSEASMAVILLSAENGVKMNTEVSDEVHADVLLEPSGI
jgi:hypothetical protein